MLVSAGGCWQKIGDRSHGQRAALPIGERDTSSSYFEWHVGEGLTQLQACHEVAPPTQRAAAL
jgi:hypothetical protein